MNHDAVDHKQLIAKLSDRERIALTEKSDAKGLIMLASHIVGLVVTGTWIASGATAWQIAILLHGIQIVFLFTLLHETVHDTPFASLSLNRMAGWGSSLLIVLPPIWFRYFHLAHHRHTHDPEKDPELQGKPIDNLGSYLWALTGLPVWWFHLRTLAAHAFLTFNYEYLPKSAHQRVRNEARIMIGLYCVAFGISFYFSSTSLLFLWIIPALLGQPFLRLYLMAEHGRCPHVANMLLNSRTTYTTAVVRWLAWNMPYHAEHHTYPAVPFHKLAQFHEVTRKHVGTLENGYSEFHRKTVSTLTDGAKT